MNVAVRIMLTAEQKKLVEDNERFIYYALRRLRYPIEDYYGVAAVGMCKAAETWDSSKETFATYAWNCIKNECWMEGRKEKKRIQPTIRLDQPIYDGTEDTSYPQIPSDDHFDERLEDESWAAEVYGRVVNGMKPKEKAAFDLFLSGKKQGDIARSIGTSQSYVSRMLIRARARCAAAAV
jgi:RNA polymerase sigma factor (sigma-70 family)